MRIFAPQAISGRRGDAAAIASYEIAGRKFAKPPSARRSKSSPASGRSAGGNESNSGEPTAPSNTASPARQASRVAVGKGEPVCLIAAPPISFLFKGKLVTVKRGNGAQYPHCLARHFRANAVAFKYRDLQFHLL